jgi:hypothetical protein
MEATTHRWRAERAAEERSPFRPHRGLATPDLFLDTMLTGEHRRHARLNVWKPWVTYTERIQTCHPKGKTYRDAQLGELVHFTVVEQLPEHEVACGSEPAWERKEDEAVAEQQPP